MSDVHIVYESQYIQSNSTDSHKTVNNHFNCSANDSTFYRFYVIFESIHDFEIKVSLPLNHSNETTHVSHIIFDSTAVMVIVPIWVEALFRYKPDKDSIKTIYYVDNSERSKVHIYWSRNLSEDNELNIMNDKCFIASITLLYIGYCSLIPLRDAYNLYQPISHIMYNWPCNDSITSSSSSPSSSSSDDQNSKYKHSITMRSLLKPLIVERMLPSLLHGEHLMDGCSIAIQTLDILLLFRVKFQSDMKMMMTMMNMRPNTIDSSNQNTISENYNSTNSDIYFKDPPYESKSGKHLNYIYYSLSSSVSLSICLDVQSIAHKSVEGINRVNNNHDIILTTSSSSTSSSSSTHSSLEHPSSSSSSLISCTSPSCDIGNLRRRLMKYIAAINNNHNTVSSNSHANKPSTLCPAPPHWHGPRSVLITGGIGAGKSHLLRSLQESLLLTSSVIHPHTSIFPSSLSSSSSSFVASSSSSSLFAASQHSYTVISVMTNKIRFKANDSSSSSSVFNNSSSSNNNSSSSGSIVRRNSMHTSHSSSNATTTTTTTYSKLVSLLIPFLLVFEVKIMRSTNNQSSSSSSHSPLSSSSSSSSSSSERLGSVDVNYDERELQRIFDNSSDDYDNDNSNSNNGTSNSSNNDNRNNNNGTSNSSNCNDNSNNNNTSGKHNNNSSNNTHNNNYTNHSSNNNNANNNTCNNITIVLLIDNVERLLLTPLSLAASQNQSDFNNNYDDDDDDDDGGGGNHSTSDEEQSFALSHASLLLREILSTLSSSGSSSSSIGASSSSVGSSSGANGSSASSSDNLITSTSQSMFSSSSSSSSSSSIFILGTTRIPLAHLPQHHSGAPMFEKVLSMPSLRTTERERLIYSQLHSWHQKYNMLFQNVSSPQTMKSMNDDDDDDDDEVVLINDKNDMTSSSTSDSNTNTDHNRNTNNDINNPNNDSSNNNDNNNNNSSSNNSNNISNNNNGTHTTSNIHTNTAAANTVTNAVAIVVAVMKDWSRRIAGLTRGYLPGDILDTVLQSALRSHQYSRLKQHQQQERGYDSVKGILQHDDGINMMLWHTILTAIAASTPKSLQGLRTNNSNIISKNNSNTISSASVSESTMNESDTFSHSNWQLFGGYSDMILKLQKLLMRMGLLSSPPAAAVVSHTTYNDVITISTNANGSSSSGSSSSSSSSDSSSSSSSSSGSSSLRAIVAAARMSGDGSRSVTATTGIVLHGPSGCGKTFLASIIAKETHMNFVSVRCTELPSKYFGETESSVRNLFSRARASTPCVLFFDDFDSIACSRQSVGSSASGTGGDASMEMATRVLSTFLNELDGISSNAGGHGSDTTIADNDDDDNDDVLIVIVACSNINLLDPALIRPGRLQYHFALPLPNSHDIQAMFVTHLNRMKGYVNSSVTSELLTHMLLADHTTGGSDIIKKSSSKKIQKNPQNRISKKVRMNGHDNNSNMDNHNNNNNNSHHHRHTNRRNTSHRSRQFTGADISGICHRAKHIAMRERIYAYTANTATITTNATTTTTNITTTATTNATTSTINNAATTTSSSSSLALNKLEVQQLNIHEPKEMSDDDDDDEKNKKEEEKRKVGDKGDTLIELRHFISAIYEFIGAGDSITINSDSNNINSTRNSNNINSITSISNNTTSDYNNINSTSNNTSSDSNINDTASDSNRF